MTKRVLLIQGAGQGAYEADRLLAASLQDALGAEYEVVYPSMPNEEDAPYEQWKHRIERELDTDELIFLAGHSVGASVLIKCLSETAVSKSVAGIFLMSAPFWGGDGWRYEGYEKLALPEAVAEKLPQGARIFLYHCRDDETVPFGHLALYARVLPQATMRELDKGGHQLGNDLSLVARDMRS